MRIAVVCVGKPRDASLGAAIREYEARAARYWPLVIHEVREEPARSATADLVREREGARIVAQLPNTGTVAACDELGTAMTSAEFASWLQREREGARDVALVIGGAYGLGTAVRARATRTIALAPWTLPHELARLVLAEQLYRAGTIVRGEPYHK